VPFTAGVWRPRGGAFRGEVVVTPERALDLYRLLTALPPEEVESGQWSIYGPHHIGVTVDGRGGGQGPQRVQWRMTV
jgi:hypothetical protein